VPEPKRSPAALLGQSSAPQKSFLFLLEEKEIALQIKKCEENFFAGWRAIVSGGGAKRQSSQSGFSSKKVRILSKRYRFHTGSRKNKKYVNFFKKIKKRTERPERNFISI